MPTKIKSEEIAATYAFMKNVYFGNWSYRWEGTPHMNNILKKNQRESILAHQLGCIGFWFNLRRICPNLNKLVDSEKIYEILWGHDLGEIFAGDVSQAMQVKGRGMGKTEIERKEIKKMAGKIPQNTIKTLLHNFDAFEQETEKMTSLEVLVCKLVDNIQGNHFGLVFGNDYKKHSKLVNKILNRSFVRTIRRLLEVLKQKGHKKAYAEVQSVVEYLFFLFKKSGTKLKLEKYK